MNCELAIDEDGEPFEVSERVDGWRVRRASDGRGRPALVHDRGKPLIVRAKATHADLAAAAGSGRYRLEAVDAQGRRVDGVPVACTGPLTAESDASGTHRNSDAGEEFIGSGSAPRQASYEDMVCHLVSANTRMVEKALGQMGSVLSGVSELLTAAHKAGIAPPPAPIAVALPPVMPPMNEELDDSGGSMSGFVRELIRQAVNAAVPLIVERLASGAGFAGLPLEAIFDWRKAAPQAPATSSPPATATSAASAPSWPPTAVYASAPQASASVGAAPGHDPSPGAAPTKVAPEASSTAQTQDTAAMVDAHVLQVWQGLAPAERALAAQLITRLTPAERAAWVTELASLAVPDAIARARAVIHGQPAHVQPTPASPMSMQPDGA